MEDKVVIRENDGMSLGGLAGGVGGLIVGGLAGYALSRWNNNGYGCNGGWNGYNYGCGCQAPR